jgi:DNA-binding MarR family transcriptional regulator
MVVLSIEQDLPNEYALVRENEYLLALETMKITEEVYLFAQRIQAAVVEREFGKFLLFTTRNLLEFETGNLQQLSLLKPQSGLRFGTLSVGIGYGETAREAKYNAGLGLLRAKKNGGSQAFKVENNAYFGPIQPEAPSGTDQQKALQIDGQFQKIADTAGISLNSVLKLQWIIDREKTDSFTSRELAGHFGVSQRSMHRLVEKLEHAGFLRIVGRNVRTAKGRPSRVVQLDLKSKAINGRV